MTNSDTIQATPQTLKEATRTLIFGVLCAVSGLCGLVIALDYWLVDLDLLRSVCTYSINPGAYEVIRWLGQDVVMWFFIMAAIYFWFSARYFSKEAHAMYQANKDLYFEQDNKDAKAGSVAALIGLALALLSLVIILLLWLSHMLS